MKDRILASCLMMITCTAFAQKKLDITAQQIPLELSKGVNRVIVNRQEINQIISQTTLSEKFSEINFVENQSGLEDLDISLVYDKLSKLKNVEFKIYNAQGELVKTYKEKDFKDTSLADGYSILTDDRLKHLKPTYYNFPLFTKFDYEIEHENTISIPSFAPVSSTDDRIMNATYELRFPENFTIKKTEQNLETYQVVSQATKNSISYQVSNLSAPEYEEMNYKYAKMLPVARFSNNTFGLGSVKGTANNWNDFGIWYYTNFLKGLNELPESTVAKIKELTKDAKDDLEKTKIVFDYVQSNTRYISIQLGLGGWKPFPAKEVAKLGYGDCKALTNYTKSLLDVVGVTSYQTIIYASDRIVDIEEKSISLQGNHMILTVPYKNDYIFLECTDQKVPFGFLGTSTVNRKALAIKPDGAIFVTTHSLNEKNNLLKGNVTVDLSNLQKNKTSVVFENHGSFYNSVYNLNTSDAKEINEYVKNVFSELKELKVVNYQSTNKKEDFIFNETIQLESAFIGSKMGNDYMFAVNSIFKFISSPKKYKNRKSGFSIPRGKTYELTTEFILPEGYHASLIPKSNTIESVFGKYSIDVTQKENKIIVEERYSIKTGDYSKEQYATYEKFVADIIQSNYSKIILNQQ